MTLLLDRALLSVAVRSGQTEALHHHRWPSVLVIDSLAKMVDFDQNGKEQRIPMPEEIKMSLVLKLPPQAAHAVKILDTHMHCISPGSPEFDCYAPKFLLLLDRMFKNATKTAPTAPTLPVFLSLGHDAPRSAPC